MYLQEFAEEISVKYKVTSASDQPLNGVLFFDLSYISGSITKVPSNVIPTLSYNILIDPNSEYTLNKFKVKLII